MSRVRLLMVLCLITTLNIAESAAAPPTTSVPFPPGAYPQPTPAPVPVPAPPVIKRRWRVLAKMWFANGTFVPVYITWYGTPARIDWPTAAVCQYNPFNRYDYRFWSPWERWGTTFEVIGPPVDDMNTPFN